MALGVGMRLVAILGGCLLICSGFLLANGPVLEFKAVDAAYAKDASDYSNIWRESGSLIVSELEGATGASLDEQRIEVIVFEGMSRSGGASEPMKLRASYAADVKRATLVHELGHRYLDAAGIEPGCVAEVHDVLSLVLFGVRANLWGKSSRRSRLRLSRKEASVTAKVGLKFSRCRHKSAA